jgi:2-oxoglutarate ferredoxin oxidoreductase subunit beta
MAAVELVETHPLDEVIRSDRMPHIWCGGCGIGIAMRCNMSSYPESGVRAE